MDLQNLLYTFYLKVFRDHLQDHDARQLEKVYIIMPEAGRGGPGIKKRIISDQDIKVLQDYKD